MLDYFALILIGFVGIVLFYGIIAIHDIPYEIAKSRKHPHQDAIHVAGWVSLFTLHIIWPFLWIWATLYREDRGWGFSHHHSLEDKLQDMDNSHQKLQDTHFELMNLHTNLSNKIFHLEKQNQTLQSTITNLRQQGAAINKQDSQDNKEQK